MGAEIHMSNSISTPSLEWNERGSALEEDSDEWSRRILLPIGPEGVERITPLAETAAETGGMLQAAVHVLHVFTPDRFDRVCEELECPADSTPEPATVARRIKPVRELTRELSTPLRDWGTPMTVDGTVGEAISDEIVAAADALVEMYDDFTPQQRAQGTPPVGVESIREWLETVLNELSVLAWHDGEVVGHVMFVPDGDRTHELAVFVHQRYQRAGIGTRLLRTGLSHGRREGVEKVWLSVEKRERGLHRLYYRVGFRVVDPTGSTYRMARSL